MEVAALMELRQRFVGRGISTLHPIVVTEGRNALLRTADGRELIDFTSGIGVTGLGHCNDRLIAAAERQLRRLWHICFAVAAYEPYLEVARKLSELAPTGSENKAALFNSGAEAVENAVKVARLATRKQGIIAFENSFHGRTYLALTTTGKYHPYKAGLEPFVPGIYHAPYPYCYRCPFGQTYPECGLACLDYLKGWVMRFVAPPDSVAAVLFEPVQGEGGFVVPPADYVRELAGFLRDQGVMLIADEVQTGFGRTGRLFGVENFGVKADLFALGKAIANGLPLSAVVGRADLMDAVHPMGLGTTFGGNPVAAAVASEVIDVVSDSLFLGRVRELGELMARRLVELSERYGIVGDVRGLGMMRALELVRDRRTKEPAPEETERVISTARSKGLLLLKGGAFGNVIRLHPPLTVERELLERGLDLLEEALREVSSGASK